MGDVTKILSDIESEKPKSAEELLPLVYSELRRVAAARLGGEKPGQTLSATALVHEAYVRLVDQKSDKHWANSRHFFGAAAEAMRRILVERARRKASLKRGGGLGRVPLEDADLEVLPLICDDLLGLHEALTKLEEKAPRKAELVKLRFFAGLTNKEAAQTLRVSVATVENDWAYARTWLRVELSANGSPDK